MHCTSAERLTALLCSSSRARAFQASTCRRMSRLLLAHTNCGLGRTGAQAVQYPRAVTLWDRPRTPRRRFYTTLKAGSVGGWPQAVVKVAFAGSQRNPFPHTTFAAPRCLIRIKCARDDQPSGFCRIICCEAASPSHVHPLGTRWAPKAGRCSGMDRAARGRCQRSCSSRHSSWKRQEGESSSPKEPSTPRVLRASSSREKRCMSIRNPFQLLGGARGVA